MEDRRIQIALNGRPRTIAAEQTVAELLEELELDGRTVVVEVNRQIVRRNELDEVTLRENDEVELVQFVGGGSS